MRYVSFFLVGLAGFACASLSPTLSPTLSAPTRDADDPSLRRTDADFPRSMPSYTDAEVLQIAHMRQWLNEEMQLEQAIQTLRRHHISAPRFDDLSDFSAQGAGDSFGGLPSSSSSSSNNQPLFAGFDASSQQLGQQKQQPVFDQAPQQYQPQYQQQPPQPPMFAPQQQQQQQPQPPMFAPQQQQQQQSVFAPQQDMSYSPQQSVFAPPQQQQDYFPQQQQYAPQQLSSFVSQDYGLPQQQFFAPQHLQGSYQGGSYGGSYSTLPMMTGGTSYGSTSPIQAEPIVHTNVVKQPITQTEIVQQPYTVQRQVIQPILKTRILTQPVIRPIVTNTVIVPKINKQYQIQRVPVEQTVVVPQVVEQTEVRQVFVDRPVQTAPVTAAAQKSYSYVQPVVSQPFFASGSKKGGY